MYANPRPSELDVDALDAVTELHDAAVASELASILGLKLTAMIGDVAETRSVRKWMSGEAVPSQRDNLVAALQATRAIIAGAGPAAAQRWFLGCNSHFNFEAPVMALKVNTPEVRTQLVRAAIAFASK